MRFIRKITLLIIIMIVGFYFLEKNDLIPSQTVDKMNQILHKNKFVQDVKIDTEIKQASSIIEDDLLMWIGKSSDELIDELGEPLRRDLSAYDYTWWVYTNELTEYVQFGISDDLIQTIYIVSNETAGSSEFIGQSYEQMNEQFTFPSTINYRNGLSTYKFQLTKDEILQRPLTKVSEDLFIQFYFDQFTNKLSSMRILTAEVLLKHTPYGIEYRGELPKGPSISEQEWTQIENGSEQQIFQITNIIRNRHQKSQLVWEEDVQEVAVSHSKDMFEQDYFSHDSLDGRSLKDRLAAKKILYQAAGENIAAQYSDGPAAVEGWLNSEGHREALLTNEFTHLGVGVYRLYFTQNFIAD